MQARKALVQARKALAKAAVAMAVVVAAGLAAPPSGFACQAPLPMSNLFGYSILGCTDARPITAFAWQPGAASPTDTGVLDIACEADLGVPPCNTMPGSNVISDSRVAISTDWSTPGINGCPTGRVYISLQCNGNNQARSALLSLSGGCAVLGYDVEASYFSNEDGTDVSLDIGYATPQQNGAPRILNYSTNFGMENFVVQVDPPFVQSDCSTGSLGQLFRAFGYCSEAELNCAGMTPPSRGNLYSFR